MKKSNLITLLIIVISFGFSFCNKRPFAHIEIHGRVVNYVTKAPVPSTISVYTGQRPGSKGSTFFGSTSTNSDGSFDFKSHAGWNSNDYYLEVHPAINSGNNSRELLCTVNKNQNLDVGDILTGSFTYFCKVTLISTSGAALDFKDIGSTSQTHFNAGATTTIMANKTYDYDVHLIFGNFYHIGYRISSSTADSNLFVPINTPPDTCVATIHY
jgi:hypothetical protein